MENAVKEKAEEFVNQAFGMKVVHKLFNEEFLIDFFVKAIYFSVKLVIAMILYKIGKKFLEKLLASYKKTKYYQRMDESLKSFFESFVTLGIKAFMVILCLVFLGMKGSNLLAFLGTMGLGVGLALKDSLSNLAGGIIILIFKNYSVNDHIDAGGLSGIVKSINVFSTSIVTFDNQVITIPNGNIISNPIINYSTKQVRRVDIVVSVGYGDDLEVAKKVLRDMVSLNEKVLKTPEVKVLIGEYADSSINIFVRSWCKTEDYWDVYYWILDQVKPTLDKHNLSIPFPQMDVHHHKD